MTLIFITFFTLNNHQHIKPKHQDEDSDDNKVLIWQNDVFL